MNSDIQDKSTMPQYQPRRRCIIKIILKNTLLAGKYCIYEQIHKQGYCFTYLSINIEDKRNYMIKFYRLDEIEDDKEMLRERYKIIKKAEILREINSPHVIKCYEIYTNQSYIAAVYEYVGKRSLKQEIYEGKIAKRNYKFILQHIYKGMDAFHKLGLMVRRVNLQNVYFKNGYYKITDFDFLKNDAQNEEDRKNSNYLHHLRADDVWYFGIFYLKLILGKKFSQFIKQSQKSSSEESLFTQQLQNITSDILSKRDQEMLKKCLMIDQKRRLAWADLDLKQQFQPDNLEDKLSRTFLILDSNNNEQDFVYSKGQEIASLIQLKQIQRDGKLYEGRHKLLFSFSNLSQEDVEIYLSSLDNSQYEIYKQLQQNHFQAQKSQYIIQNILKPIERLDLLDFSTRKNVQFMYLVSSRCFTNLSYINHSLSKWNPAQKQQNKKIIDQYEQNVRAIYTLSQEYFQKYSEDLTKAENRINNKLFNKFFKSQQERLLKDKYLAGIEGFDYKKCQQIYFTQNRYIQKIIIIEIKEKAWKYEKDVQLLIKILNKYSCICNLKDQNEIKGIEFEDCIKMLLENQSIQKSDKQKIEIVSRKKNNEADTF